MAFDPNTDSVDGTENFYSVGDLVTRVRVLERADCGGNDPETLECTSSECPSCCFSAKRELAGLRELLDDASLGLDYFTLYRNSFMPDYAEEYAKDIGGREAVDMLDSYVDWDRFGGDLAMDMPDYMIFGHTYHAH
jgi:hypothetical protein